MKTQIAILSAVLSGSLVFGFTACSPDGPTTPTPIPVTAVPVQHPVTPPPATPTVEVMTMAMYDGDHQQGAVDVSLDAPLRVKVLVDGVPKAGVFVYWQTSSGTVSDLTTTDAAGLASAQWRLGTKVGGDTASAYLSVGQGVHVATIPFTATAVAGPAARIMAQYGNGATRPVNNWNSVFSLGAIGYDRFNNTVLAPAIAWTIVDGPLEFAYGYHGELVTPNFQGTAWMAVQRTGTLGAGRIRATVQATGASVDFTVTITDVEYDVYATDDYGDDLHFQSAQNGSGDEGVAAVDTVPVGATVHFINQTYFATRQIVSVGSPSFPNSPVFAEGASYSVMFPSPGVYRYADATDPTLMFGIIVVLP